MVRPHTYPQAFSHLLCWYLTKPFGLWLLAGIVTAEGEVELDVIIFATGFDSLTGQFKSLSVQGRKHQLLWPTPFVLSIRVPRAVVDTA